MSDTLDPLGDARAWIDARAMLERPTEILIPVVEGIGPVWSHATSTGGWFAYLSGALRPLDEGWHGVLTECDHVHPTEADAWGCARQLAQGVVNALGAGRER
jgi:hypothetical protein